MKIAIAQLNPTIGSFRQNLALLNQAAQKAHFQGAGLLVTPEHFLSGTPARDLLATPAFVADLLKALAEWISEGTPAGLALALSVPLPREVFDSLQSELHSTPSGPAIAGTRPSSELTELRQSSNPEASQRSHQPKSQRSLPDDAPHQGFDSRNPASGSVPEEAQQAGRKSTPGAALSRFSGRNPAGTPRNTPRSGLGNSPTLQILKGWMPPSAPERLSGLLSSGLLIKDGQILQLWSKNHFRGYGGFHESLYFTPGSGPKTFQLEDRSLILAFADDLLCDPGLNGQGPSYGTTASAIGELKEKSNPLVLALSASPFCVGKIERRSGLFAQLARSLDSPLIFANQVGSSDGLLFDGSSFALDRHGNPLVELASFKEKLSVFELPASIPTQLSPAQGLKVTEGIPKPEAAAPQDDAAKQKITEKSPEERLWTPLDSQITPKQLDQLHDALVMGLADHLRKTGFEKVVIPLSGGMDSALVAVLAARAASPENVLTIALPSRYTLDISNEDATSLAGALGIRHISIPIESPLEAHLEVLKNGAPEIEEAQVEENLQARIRGALSMAMANATGALLLACGNKSELATGYCTLYGDMAGALAPIGDVPKTLVYALARRINLLHRQQTGKVLIPERIIERPPSAELREGQSDQDSLPPYDQLDRILRRAVEGRQNSSQISAKEGDIPPETVKQVLRWIRLNEHKRQQAALILQISSRSFGRDHQMPLAHGWNGTSDGDVS